MPRDSKPAPIGSILQKLATNPELTQDARDAIRDGLTLDRYKPSPQCPCERCHRVYRTIP
jgi:hypothetical protein